MPYSRSIKFLLIALSTILFYSCSNTKFLTGDQVLYTGRKVNIVSKEKVENKKALKEVIEQATASKMNNSLFGKKRLLPPFGLWVHNYLKPKKEGKKGSWLYRTFQNEPILIEQVNPEQRCKEIESALLGIGFFNSKAIYKIETGKRNPRKGKISYTINVDHPFRVDTLVNAPVVDSVDSIIKSYTGKLEVKQGDFFNLDAIKSDKRNISSELTDLGYYYFGPDYVKFIGDTSEAPYRVDMMIGKNPETPDYAVLKYTIDKISVKVFGVTDSLADASLGPDSVIYDGIAITGLKNYLKPEVITRCIQFRQGDIYSTSKHQKTIRQLNNYGVFKYVKMQFFLQDSTQQKLDVTIELSPKDNVSLDLEGFVQAKSTGFAGPGMEVTVAHGNLGQEANRLQLKLNGGFEWQLGTNNNDQLGSNSYNAGISSSFVFPKFVLPFHIPGQNKLLSSKTVCNIGFDFTNNVRYYRMAGVNLGFSYQWKRRLKITNIFYPFKVNVVNLIETTPEFDTIVDTNPYVKKSFEEQSIYGMEYSFIYDNAALKKNGFYLQATVGTAGNLIDFIKSGKGSERPYSLFGNVYSQFLKTSVDARFYTKTIKQGYVFRFYAGAGFSYKNSAVMPYVEQFYSGGSNSLRGFTARSIGPGSYRPVEYNGIVDQTGDIKLEFNVEYRFKFSKTVLGALFAETGNVWLLNEDVSRPGAEFDFNTFANQLAVGAGIGLRFDFDYFVLRTDFGVPLRSPYVIENGYWIGNMDDALSGIKLNIAIGFPF